MRKNNIHTKILEYYREIETPSGKWKITTKPGIIDLDDKKSKIKVGERYSFLGITFIPRYIESINSYITTIQDIKIVDGYEIYPGWVIYADTLEELQHKIRFKIKEYKEYIKDIKNENNFNGDKKNILISRVSKERRLSNWIRIINIKIQNYIKDGMVGDLYLSHTSTKYLPSNLTSVGGYLFLHNCPISKLPDNLKSIKGNLFLVGTNIKSLPDNLTVLGNIYLNNTNIEKLPNGLIVGGSLFLNGTKIKSLPNMNIGIDLQIKRTEIDILPDKLNIGGKLFLLDTPLSGNGELLNKYSEIYDIVI